jgi:hypothetical protein
MVERISTGGPALRSAVMTRLGGPPVEWVHLVRHEIQPIIGELLLRLQVLCGALEEDDGRFSVTAPSRWRCLTDVTPAELSDTIRRLQRDHPNFALAGDDRQPVHTRLAHLLSRIEEGR